MNAILTYLLASIVSLGIFYAAFAVFLRKEPLFLFNRFYLLSALFLSYVIPILSFFPEFFSANKIIANANGIINTITLSPVIINANTSNLPTLTNMFAYIYFVGLGIFVSRLLIRLLNIYKLKKNGTKSVENETNLLWIYSDIPPFSFLKTMYLPINLKESTALDEIIRHESIHIKSFHSFDILFIEVLQTIFWFNPFIPLVGKSLRETHEFEADKAVIGAGTDPVDYTKILFSQDKIAMAVVLGNNFNYSLIKRRLTMFYKKNSRFAQMKAVLVLPVAIFLVIAFSVSCQQATESIPPPPPPPPVPPTEVAASTDEIFTVVETMPQFPGGDEGRTNFLMNNLKYPAKAIEKGVQGKVFVSFVVEKDGSIGDVKLLRGIDESCDAEAVRVVSSMPKWQPGKQNGEAVRVQFNMPISFKLSK